MLQLLDIALNDNSPTTGKTPQISGFTFRFFSSHMNAPIHQPKVGPCRCLATLTPFTSASTTLTINVPKP